VIGTNAGAIPDTIPQDAGLLVDADDVAALAGALHRAIVDPHLRQKLSEAALAAARQLPTWAQSAERFADALDALT
jgi:glycosyltransferase involved in cell wall biosynthesis